MNYRHAYHAGNFADVFKHAIMARILVHLAKKETPFRMIDTHAGRGLYDLAGKQAQQTGEWIDGIGRVLKASLPFDVQDLLSPWLGIVRPMFEKERRYPGSPVLAIRLARLQDRLVFCEKHPEEADELARYCAGMKRVQMQESDGWAALAGLLPPPERRGLVLIDPPFEEKQEFRTLVETLQGSLKRWESGIYAVWYPIKARREVERFARQVQTLGVKALRAELVLYTIERVDRLNGCGMMVLNPPWHLKEEIERMSPALLKVLAREAGARHAVEWLVAEGQTSHAQQQGPYR